MIRRLRIWPATLLAIVVVSLAGCSSSDDGANGVAPASDAATATSASGAAATASPGAETATATASPQAAEDLSEQQIYLDTAGLLLNRLAEQSLSIAEAIVDPALGSDAWNDQFGRST